MRAASETASWCGPTTSANPSRDCEVLKVHGEAGGPPYVVRWGDDGHEGLYFPGEDAEVEHFSHRGRPD